MPIYQELNGKRLGQAAVTATYATVYTCPTNTQTYLREVDLCNTTGGALGAYVSIVPAGDSAGTANALMYNKSIAANDMFQWAGIQILNSGDTVQVRGSSTGLTITLSGGEAT